MTNKIDLTKSLPRERWGEFFDQFSDGNRGRHLAIEVINAELGDEELIQDAPLMAMIYDRPGKGDDLVIEIGKDQVTYAHTIDAPIEIFIGQTVTGEIVAISIYDTAKTKTLITLQSR